MGTPPTPQYYKSCFLGYCPMCGKPIFHNKSCVDQSRDCEKCPDKMGNCKKHADAEFDCECFTDDVIKALFVRIIELEVDLSSQTGERNHESTHYLPRRTGNEFD